MGALYKTVPARARVKVQTERGYWLLAEIRGLKEGTELTGRYCERTHSFDFRFNDQDAVLIIGENAELIND